MNAGKSSTLLQASYNYNERGLRTLLFIPKLIGSDRISSRIGLSAPALQFDPDFDFIQYVRGEVSASQKVVEGEKRNIGCVLIDEAQFLNQAQVIQLTKIADELQIPVLCYGLRSDFVGEPFEGSKYLLIYADVMTEIKTICACGRKATMNQRIRADGTPVGSGAQVEVGGNDRYVGKCRHHFHEGLAQAALTEKADEASLASEEPLPAKRRKLSEDLVTPVKDAESSPVDRTTSISPSSA